MVTLHEKQQRTNTKIQEKDCLPEQSFLMSVWKIFLPENNFPYDGHMTGEDLHLLAVCHLSFLGFDHFFDHIATYRSVLF